MVSIEEWNPEKIFHELCSKCKKEYLRLKNYLCKSEEEFKEELLKVISKCDVCYMKLTEGDKLPRKKVYKIYWRGTAIAISYVEAYSIEEAEQLAENGESYDFEVIDDYDYEIDDIEEVE